MYNQQQQNNQIQELIRKIELLELERELTKTDLKEKESNIDQLTESNCYLRSVISANERENNNWRGTFDNDSPKDILNYMKRLENAKNDLDTVERVLNNLRNENGGLNVEVLVAYKDALSKLNKAQQKIEDLRNKLEFRKFENDDLQDNIDEVKREFDSKVHEISRLK